MNTREGKIAANGSGKGKGVSLLVSSQNNNALGKYIYIYIFFFLKLVLHYLSLLQNRKSNSVSLKINTVFKLQMSFFLLWESISCE